MQIDENHKNKHELLELYKLHADLADRTLQRREGANRQYISITSLLLVSMGIILRFGHEEQGGLLVGIILFALGMAGVMIAAIWFLALMSYQGIRFVKMSELLKLEQFLSYPFLKNESAFFSITFQNMKDDIGMEKIERHTPLTFMSLFASSVTCAIAYMIVQIFDLNTRISLDITVIICIIWVFIIFLSADKIETKFENNL